MLGIGKKKTGKVTCSTYIENLVAVIVHLLNLLKINDPVVDEKIDQFKKLAKSIKYEENTEKLERLRDSIMNFIVEYDNYVTEKKSKLDRMVLSNIAILVSIAKSADGSKKWVESLEKVKQMLKERLDLETLQQTKEILLKLGLSSRDTRDVVYRDLVRILFSLMDVETDSQEAKKYQDEVKALREKLTSNPNNLDLPEIRKRLKELIEKKERLESEYIQSLHKKLNKALQALIYTISTFSESSSSFSYTFQNHIDEINDMISSKEIDVDELSKRLIAIAIKIKDTTISMQEEINRYSQKLKEAQSTIEDLRRKLNEAQMNMITDPLTGVYNRRGLFHFLSQEIERALRYKQPFSIIMADLDHFSDINNTYGHLAGDIVLKKFCSTVLSMIRKVDIMGRYGGEEFVIILPNTTVENAYQVAEKIRLAISKLKFQYKDKVFGVTSSFGVTQFKESDTVESILKRADKALYKAKETRNATAIGE